MQGLPIHATQGIVLRLVKYGETSIIVTILTQKFGIQSYLIKGIFKKNKKNASQSTYFQTGAILNLQVTHQPFRQLQYVKEFSWSYIYKHVYYDVAKNAIAVFVADVLLHALKEPETNEALFDWVANFLQLTDTTAQHSSSLPLFFLLQFSNILGFGIQGRFSEATPYFSLHEGCFIHADAQHLQTSSSNETVNRTLSELLNHLQHTPLTPMAVNRSVQQMITDMLLLYMEIHIPDFGKLKSIEVLKAVFGN